MRFVLAALAVLAGTLTPPLAAQDDVRFAPGIVVSLEGDTLRGEIALVPDFEKMRGVTFRATPSAAPATFTHREAQSYQIDGGTRFVHRWIDFNTEGTRGAHTFLRELVPGPRTLYVHHLDTGADTYYIEGTDFPIEGLFEVTSQRGPTQSRQLKLWVGTLNRAFQSCRALLDDVAEARYRERDLVDLTVQYNTCVEPGYRFTPRVDRVDQQSGYALHFAVEGSFGVERLAASFVLDTALEEPDAFRSSYALRGVGLVEVKAWPNTWYGVVELGLENYGPYERLEERSDVPNYDPLYLALGLGAQYDFSAAPVAPFLRATYVLGWTVAGQQQATLRREANALGGFALTGGVVWDVTLSRGLSFGVRASWLDLSDEFIYIPFGDNKIGQHTTYAGVLGIRL
ncbi:MAG: hypothetical protein AAFP18_14485 [Bacteroidota bacterium]